MQNGLGTQGKAHACMVPKTLVAADTGNCQERASCESPKSQKLQYPLIREYQNGSSLHSGGFGAFDTWGVIAPRALILLG